MDIYTLDEQLHMQHAAQCKRDRAISRALANRTTLKEFASEIEAVIIDRLRENGRFVARTAAGEHYDLLVDGLRVEVKAARPSGGFRYHANLRANDADVLIFVCHDGAQLHYFVIPFDRIAGLTQIEICNADPAAYAGWMAAWRDAWHIIDQFIARGLNHWQPALI